MVFFFLSAQASRQVADYFIRWWTRDQFGKYLATCTDDCGSMYYVRWYAVLGLGFFIGLMLFRGAFLYLWTLGASERIREKSIHRILNAPLGFFLQVCGAGSAAAGCSPAAPRCPACTCPGPVHSCAHTLTLLPLLPPCRPPSATCSSRSPRTRACWTTRCPTPSTTPASTRSS
jgi:hypothetical protein